MIRRLVVAVGCAAASFVIAMPVGAQTGVLSGVIYDQTNKVGLAGAEVRIKGTDLVTISGKDGRFTIAGVPAGAREIETVRTGYRPYRLPSVRIVAADTVHVYLALATLPEERAAKEDVPLPGETWSIGKVGKTTSVGDVSENAPMYIIDGVVLSAGLIPLSLDSLDILSVEVIKGAAAQSLYGSRAANGVIMIKTRP